MSQDKQIPRATDATPADQEPATSGGIQPDRALDPAAAVVGVRQG